MHFFIFLLDEKTFYIESTGWENLGEIFKPISESSDFSDKISIWNRWNSKAKQWLDVDPKKYVLETIENYKKGSWQCPSSLKQAKDLQRS